MTIAQAILKPSATVVILAEVTAGISVRNWINLGSTRITEAGDRRITEAGDVRVTESSNTFRAEVEQPVTAVKHNDTTLTEVATLALVDSTPGSWFYSDGVLYVNPPTDESMYGDDVNVSATVAFYFSNYPKNLENRHYDPRVKSAPALSMRIEKTFTGVGQVGGGTMSLLNADQFFDDLQDIQWNYGTVTLKLGIDVNPDSVMAYADYQTVATWDIEDWENDIEFKLKLIERKSRLTKKIPKTFYNRTTHPTLPDDELGKPVQRAWGVIQGVRPVCVGIADKRFKVAGHAIYSFDGVKIKNPETDAWEAVDFATTNEDNAVFTLGAEWEEGTEISVDFTGKMNGDGTPMLNAAVIVEDILALCGETNINVASFAQSHGRLSVGFDSNGNEVHLRSPSIYLDTVRDGISVVSEINAIVGSYLFNDATGQYYYGVFEPMPGEALALFEEIDLLSYLDKSDTAQIASLISLDYAMRPQEEFRQSIELERTSTQYANGARAAIVVKKALNMVSDDDAQYWAERFLVMMASPLRLFTCDVPWRGFTLLPGDQIHLTNAHRGIDKVLEVMEAKVDLLAKKTSLVLSDLRGLKDTSGFWVDDADVLPTRFAAEAGYGAGSLVWNSSWSDTIKTWARQNVGYWTTEEGFADPNDPQSFLCSTWV